jgi:TonB-dependent receptor
MNNPMKISFQKILLMALLLISTSAFAQGTLRGVVTDTLDRSPLVGANVYLIGTALGSATNLEGEYRIDRIPAGAYTLRVSYIGYRTRMIKADIQNNGATLINATLAADAVELGSVTVTGQAVGQAAAINQQITSNTIINVVSEEKIRELPDANAAESIGRLPGVSILRSGGEANKIILRGLDDKFTNITIDGVKIPPTDATSRGVDLSTLSQSSLAGIELFKAATPDKDGDALAGSINLVTKKAPETRRIKADVKGDYNKLMESANQHDLSLHYGERFFNQTLGVQLAGNLEKRIRSNERIDVDYNQQFSEGRDYFINDFSLEFTDEIRKRDGFSVLLDLNTPDNGSIRFNNVFGRTKRDYLLSTRDYPSNGGGDQQGNPVYGYRDREQEINTYSGSIRGDNNLAGLRLNWGLSLGQSESDFPFDYEATFVEPSGMQASPMLRHGPEQLITYAENNFSNASLYWAYFRSQRNFDKERTAFLDMAKPYLFSPKISGEIKIGGKYKTKDRSNARAEDFTPYYLGRWQTHELLPDGSRRKKDFTGTYFEAWQKAGGLFIPINQFFSAPASRNVYDSYRLNPLIDRERLRQWRELNKNGVDVTGNQYEIGRIRSSDMTIMPSRKGSAPAT